MREKKLLDLVRRQCVLSAVHFATPQKRPLPDSSRHKKKKSRTSTRQGTKVTEDSSGGIEVDVAASNSDYNVEESEVARRKEQPNPPSLAVKNEKPGQPFSKLGGVPRFEDTVPLPTGENVQHSSSRRRPPIVLHLLRNVRLVQTQKTIEHVVDDLGNSLRTSHRVVNVPRGHRAGMLLNHEDVQNMMMLVWYWAEYSGGVERCVGENIRKPPIWEQGSASKDESLPTGLYCAQSSEVMQQGFPVLEGFEDVLSVPHRITIFGTVLS